MLRKSAFVALCAFLAFTACALRPRYNELVKAVTGDQAPQTGTVSFRIVDPNSGAPIAGAVVTAGDGKSRLQAKSDLNGVVTLPWSEATARDNPLVVVDLPGTASAYQIQPAPQAAPMAPSAPVAVPTGTTTGSAPANISSQPNGNNGATEPITGSTPPSPAEAMSDAGTP